MNPQPWYSLDCCQGDNSSEDGPDFRLVRGGFRATNREEAEASSSSTTFFPQVGDGDILAQEMNALSVQERDRLYEEVHGISEGVIEETPELVAASLKEMREELARLTKRAKIVRPVSRAFFLQPTLASDDNFHLLFLRCERFDTIEAAAKMARYFDHKALLWGEEKLVKRITLEDLGEKEMQHMQWGSVQTPVVNNKGVRCFLFTPTANYDISDWKAFVRYEWYQMMTMILEDEQVQKRGIVTVSRYTGQWLFSPTQIIDMLMRGYVVLRDFPIKILGNHVCIDSPALNHFPSIFNTMAGKQLRLHTRTHFGADLELQYSLMTFGIRLPHQVVTNDDGPRKMGDPFIQSYLEERRRIEAEWDRQAKENHDGSSSLKPLLHPRPEDVIMGRGRPFRDWPGNTLLTRLVAGHANDYRTATDRIYKTILAVDTMKRIQETGGQFIERIDTGWVIMDDAVVKPKVNQLLRAHARDQRGDDDEMMMILGNTTATPTSGTSSTTPTSMVMEGTTTATNGYGWYNPKRARIT